MAAAEELNLHRAAHRLEITQPALTKQIGRLEEQMGVSLFARERHRLAGLTAAGTSFLADARHILEQVEDAIRSVQLVAAGRSGRLRLGLTDDAATPVLSSILAALHARSPNVLVELIELTGVGYLPALHANVVDLALAPEPQEADGFAVEELWRESWSVILPEEHTLFGKNAIASADLAGEPLAMVRSWAQEAALARLRAIERRSDLASGCILCLGSPHSDHAGPRRFRDRARAIFFGIGRGPPAVMRPLLLDPGYAVVALTHDIDPPPGLVGQFLNVAREVAGSSR